MGRSGAGGDMTAPLTGTITLPGVTIEPAELRGMAAMLQAVGSSVRTRLGAGPRMVGLCTLFTTCFADTS